jgi:hypothetical protein
MGAIAQQVNDGKTFFDGGQFHGWVFLSEKDFSYYETQFLNLKRILAAQSSIFFTTCSSPQFFGQSDALNAMLRSK